MALATWLLETSKDERSTTSLKKFSQYHLNEKKKERKKENKNTFAELQASIEIFIETLSKCSDFIPKIYGQLKSL